MHPAKLHLVDMWGTERYGHSCKDEVLAKFATEIAQKKVQINEGRSVEVLKKFDDHYFYFIY